VANDKAAKKGKAEADSVADEAAAADAEGLDGLTPPKRSKKKLIIILVAVTLLLLGGGGAGLYFTGIIGGHKTAAKDGEKDSEHKDAKSDKEHKAYFYDLGDMMVNLSGDGRRPSMLKLKMTLELDDEKDKAMMDSVKPRVLDSFQIYLRELRVDDLKGSAGMYRLREELLLRVAEAAHPAKVRDVLIIEMLVQ
jgi:flagellar protein FliL